MHGFDLQTCLTEKGINYEAYKLNIPYTVYDICTFAYKYTGISWINKNSVTNRPFIIARSQQNLSVNACTVYYIIQERKHAYECAVINAGIIQ